MVSQINLNHAKVPSLTLLENIDKEWNPDIKHVICIQEPFKNYKTGRIKNTSKNYKNFFSNKSKYPRAIIQVSKPFDREVFFHEELSDRDNCVISIEDPKTPGKRIFMASNYLHESENINECQLNNIMKTVNRKKNGFISCSDTNAHSIAWGNDKNNKRGDDLELLMSQHNLDVRNIDLSPTFHRGTNYSTIDLTLTNEHAPKILNWKILKGKSHSDHELIKFEIDLTKRSETEYEKKTKLKRKTNTNLYKNLLNKQVKDIKFPLENTKNNLPKREMKHLINIQAEQITNIMINSWEESSKTKPNVKTRRRKGKWPEKSKASVLN